MSDLHTLQQSVARAGKEQSTCVTCCLLREQSQLLNSRLADFNASEMPAVGRCIAPSAGDLVVQLLLLCSRLGVDLDREAADAARRFAEDCEVRS